MVHQKIIWFVLKIFIQGFGGVLPIVFYILKNKEQEFHEVYFKRISSKLIKWSVRNNQVYDPLVLSM